MSRADRAESHHSGFKTNAWISRAAKSFPNQNSFLQINYRVILISFTIWLISEVYRPIYTNLVSLESYSGENMELGYNSFLNSMALIGIDEFINL